MSDAIVGGKRIRILSIVDKFNRERPAGAAQHSARSDRATVKENMS